MAASLEPCRPPFWARGGHGQTLAGHLVPSLPLRLGSALGRFEEVRVPLSGGDALRCLHGAQAGPVVVTFFHGLSGHVRSDYMRRGAALVRQKGWRPVLVEHRGAGSSWAHSRGTYHSGSTTDAAAVIESGRELYPDALHLAVGFSLSGNILLGLLSGVGQKFRSAAQPDAVLAINPPTHLDACAEALNRGFNRVYEQRFVRRLSRMVRRRVARGLPGPQRLERGLSLRGFDELYTAPFAGFAGVDDYYRRCSTHERLTRIERPTVILTASDDPLVPFELLADAPRSAAVRLEVSSVGGHMGYFAGRPTTQGTRRWLDHALEVLLTELVERAHACG